MPPPLKSNGGPAIYIVDFNFSYADAARTLFEENGFRVELFGRLEEFLDAQIGNFHGYLIVDALMLGISGVDLIGRLNGEFNCMPTIVTASNGTLSMAVQAMRAGAADFIDKSSCLADLLASVRAAMTRGRLSPRRIRSESNTASDISGLTQRQNLVLQLVLAGHPSKNIAADLGVSQRTVENHRAHIGKRTGAKSLSGLIQATLCAKCLHNSSDAGRASDPAVSGVH